MARVPANSYGNGTKYSGGNTFKDSSGKSYTASGDYTSPSGKGSYIGSDGSITTTHSSDRGQIGNVYTPTGGGGGGGSLPTYELSYNKSYGKAGSGRGVNMQVSALERAMSNNRSALKSAYTASKGELESSIGSAKQQAYLASEKAKQNLPQVMAAAGYNGGVTETTAAGIANEYIGALNDLSVAQAQEMARIEANYANGVAQSDTQYEIQLANALAQAEQLAYQQDMAQEELRLKQQAAAIQQQKFLESQTKSLSKDTEYSAPTAFTIPRQSVQGAMLQLDMFNSASAAVNYIKDVSKEEGFTNDEINMLLQSVYENQRR